MDYINCFADSSGLCKNATHSVRGRPGKIGPDGICDNARALKRRLQPCIGCKTKVPSSVGFKMNSTVVKAVIAGKEGGLVMPRAKANIGKLWIACFNTESLEVRFCDDCAQALMLGINSESEFPGYVEIAGQPEPVPVLIEIKASVPRERHAQNIEQRPVRKKPEKGSPIGFKSLVKGLRNGEFVDRASPSTRRNNDGVEETQCIVNYHASAECICGGGRNWSMMLTVLISSTFGHAVGFECASMLRKHGVPVEDLTFEDFIGGIRGDAPKTNPSDLAALLGLNLERTKISDIGLSESERLSSFEAILNGVPEKLSSIPKGMKLSRKVDIIIERTIKDNKRKKHEEEAA